ncbi:MAG: methyltransferase domain-containing protein [Desulfobacterales bacterium]|nr:methyltransferase domain-containing protein [Desulfobacterales bacterium]
MNKLCCRFCGTSLTHTFVDLGMSPLSNAYLKKEQLQDMEPFYPLHVRACDSCFLVQLPVFESPDQIFGDYAYFSSYSDTWLLHAKEYTEMIADRLGLGPNHLVVEIASNDGYLLQNFISRKIPVLGIEPSANVAKVAEEKGIPTLVRFFGRKLADELVSEGKRPDLIIGNNVLAHVPDLNDFVTGLKILLKPGGVITMEFPHLMRLILDNQFDTIYHEHFSYLSLITVEKVFAAHGLTLFDVEELTTHGGSLRTYIRHTDNVSISVEKRVGELRRRELEFDLARMTLYTDFAEKVKALKRSILEFLIQAKVRGKTVVGYGAPAKGNTLLNYCGIRLDFLEYTVDRSPYKQGLYLPGTHIPIYHPDRIRETRPDYVFILPWNLKEEIMEQMNCIRDWGGRFIVAIPNVEVLP